MAKFNPAATILYTALAFSERAPGVTGGRVAGVLSCRNVVRKTNGLGKYFNLFYNNKINDLIKMLIAE